jgi:hypothetical protein
MFKVPRKLAFRSEGMTEGTSWYLKFSNYRFEYH